MMRAGLVAASLLVWPVLAQANPLQENFNAAQAAIESQDFAKAAAGFEKLLEQLANADPTDRTIAVVRSRLGAARLELGDYEGAAEVLAQALPGLAGEGNAEERRATLYDLGKTREILLDYEGARAVLTELISEAEANQKKRDKKLAAYRLALARVSLFEDPALARRQIDLALPALRSSLGRRNAHIGEVYTLRGRAELMAGNVKEAYDWFKRALRVAGGLGTTVSVSDVRIRGDLAIAAQLLGRQDDARKYLASTGAGLLRDENPLRGVDMPLPACGDATGLRPDDAAVVEFAIGDDGLVKFAQPIYATRTGPVALEFARTVAGWTWTPEEAQKIGQFWRKSIRLELRCTKQVQRLDVATTFKTTAWEWWQARLGPQTQHQEIEQAPAGRQAIQLREGLAGLEAKVGKDHLSLLWSLFNLSQNPTVRPKESKQLLGRALAIAEAHDAPLDVITLLKIAYISRQPDLEFVDGWLATREEIIRLIQDRKQRNEIENRSGAWLLVELARMHEQVKYFDEAEEVYREVLAMPEAALSADDLVRQLAVVRLASLKAAAKQFDEAEGLLQSAGLNPDQCALVDAKPVSKSAYIGFSDFPREALKWEFEGWVKVSYDINTEGRVVEPRAVIAYPPFVFGQATEEMVKRFRYQPIYRSGETIGCTGYERSVRYEMER